MPLTIHINPADNVVVALHPIARGTAVDLPDLGRTVTAAEDIPQGHKMAIAPIAAGENVIKYGFPIGHATADAAPGAWMHTHNVKTNLSGEVAYTYHPDLHPLTPAEPGTFLGFRRADGRAAIRNEIWIIPTVGCVNDCAKALVRDNQDLVTGTIDGLYTFPHPFGCSQTGHDHAQTRKLLAALVRHPNAAAVLVLSLGCENLTHEQFLEELGDYDHDRVRFLTCQEVEDELAAGREILKELADYAGRFRRQPIPVSELVVGMKCGGSDGLSGVTANPTIGRFSDMLCARGGSTVLTEVPEMFGAEGFLMNRCRNEEVFGKAVRMINGFDQRLQGILPPPQRGGVRKPQPRQQAGGHHHAGGQELRLCPERGHRPHHGCDRLRRRRHHQGAEPALRPGQRPGVGHRPHRRRGPPDPVFHRAGHPLRRAGAHPQGGHQHPAGRKEARLDRLQHRRHCRRKNDH